GGRRPRRPVPRPITTGTGTGTGIEAATLAGTGRSLGSLGNHPTGPGTSPTTRIGGPLPLQGPHLIARPRPRLPVRPPQLVHDQQQEHQASRHREFGTRPQAPRQHTPARGPPSPPLHHHRNPLAHGPHLKSCPAN
ncbi:hypothetical protein ACM614_08405, partial [Streptomyces sp. 12297]